MNIMSISLILFLIITSSLVTIRLAAPTTVFNVLDYGAVGDGQTDDTKAFNKAWKDLCGCHDDSATMLVPSGMDFFVQPMSFQGPCNSKHLLLQIDGNLVAPTEPSDWKCIGACNRWVDIHRVDGIHVIGSGTLSGRGQKWWSKSEHSKPAALEISNSNNVLLSGLSFKDNPRVHIVLNSLNNITVTNITIDSPEKSPNSDGIHVTGSINVIIDDCHIATGDDCISIVDGAAYVTISNIVCGPGHGISIGSLGHNGANDKVEYIHVMDSVFIGATNGVRIKTWQGGRGYARHMLFEKILSHESNYPIIIDQSYCIDPHCLSNSDSAVQVQNVTYRQVMGTTKRKQTGIKLDCSPAKPCKEMVFEDIYIVSTDNKEAPYKCGNVQGEATGHMVPSIKSCLN